jgi:hypothetical protein
MNDIVNKEEILKNYQNSNKLKQSISTFDPKRYMPEKKNII